MTPETGSVVWESQAGDWQVGYYMTMAPLAVNGKVLVGVSGGELGIRGFVAAFDAETGAEVWRRHTVPGAGRAGQRDLAGRYVAHRGNAGMGDRHVRPGAEPDVLGHRERRALDGRPAAGRQPVCETP